MTDRHRTKEFWRGTKVYRLPKNSVFPGATLTFGTPLLEASREDEAMPAALRKVRWMEAPSELQSVRAVAKRPGRRLPDGMKGDAVPWNPVSYTDRRERDALLLLLGKVRAGEPCSYLMRPLSVPDQDFDDLSPDGPFILEELGPSLSEVLPSLAADERLRLVAMTAVCAAESLAYLAFHGRVHRDVTMNNLMLGRPVERTDHAGVASVDHIALGDFGHASSRDDQVAPSTSDSQLPRQTLGTSFVQAPSLLQTIGETEAEGYRRADLASDLFALGVSLHAAALNYELPWTEGGTHLDWRQAPNPLRDVRNFAARVRDGSILPEPDHNRLEELRSSPLGEALIEVINVLLDESRIAACIVGGTRITGELADDLASMRRLLPGLIAATERPRLPVPEAWAMPVADASSVPAALGADPLRRPSGPPFLGSFLPEQPMLPSRSSVVVRATGRGAIAGLGVLGHAANLLVRGICKAGDEVGRILGQWLILLSWFCSLAVSITALVRLTGDYGALPGALWWWIAGGVLAGLVLGIAVLLQDSRLRTKPRIVMLGLWAGCVGFVPGLVGIGWREVIRHRLLWWNPDIDGWGAGQITAWFLLSAVVALMFAPLEPGAAARTGDSGIDRGAA